MTTSITFERFARLLQARYQKKHPHESQVPGLITVEELAAVLGMSAQSIRNITCRTPKLLPKPIRFDGLRRVYFPFDEVAFHLYANYIRQEEKNRTAFAEQ